MTDAELVAEARAGDRSAFDAIVQRYQHAVFRAALAVTADRSEAEDAAQDTFLKAYRFLGDFRGESSLKTWLLAIAWREGLSRRRSIACRLRRLVAPSGDEPFDPPEPRRSSEARLVAVEHAAAVRRLVASLPDKYRVPLLLSASGDYTFDEIAEALGVPCGTVKWRVSDARRQLRAKLAAMGYT